MKKLGIISLGFICVFSLLFYCGNSPQPSFRIAGAQFSHETCSFCPDPTTVQDWEYCGLPAQASG